jgi:hypothetical protein
MAIGEQMKKLQFVGTQALKNVLNSNKGEQDPAAPETVIKPNENVSESSNDMIRALVGGVDVVGEFYFPPDLIGGTCPRIAGEEEEIVWNAAAEACDTERVHVVWQSVGNRIWYLAVRSSDLATHTDTWCPLATMLPSEKDIADLPICYTYFGEEIAVLMVVGVEELHIFRGTGPVVRAKAERTARELNNCQIINIDLFRIGQLTAVPWYSASLFEDRARRILAAVSVAASLAIVGLSFLVWLSASLAMISARHESADALDRTQTKSMELMRQAEAMRASPMREQLEKFLNVNDGLISLNGFLNVYEIKDQKTRWRAVVPPSATADRISAIGGKNIEATDQGVAIGNDAEVEYEATRRK